MLQVPHNAKMRAETNNRLVQLFRPYNNLLYSLLEAHGVHFRFPGDSAVEVGQYNARQGVWLSI